ncbi:MAG: hypothetical protein K0R50_2083 [Eubacterium sp.]|jgi:hypothetical protein|nr:hypothetical protein [Eubacterium sp.]
MNKRLKLFVGICCIVSLFSLAACTLDESSVVSAGGNSTYESSEVKSSMVERVNLIEVTSPDGKIKASIPEGWTEDNLDNPDASIQLSNEEEFGYTLIVIEDKADYDTSTKLADYQKIILDSMVDTLGGTEAVKKSEPESIKVNNYQAIQCDLEGFFEGTSVKYLITCIDAQDHYLQVVSWSYPGKFDSNKDDFNTVLNSIKLTSEQ